MSFIPTKIFLRLSSSYASEHIKSELYTTTISSDLSLHFKSIEGTLQELITTRVNDTLGIRTSYFQKQTLKNVTGLGEKTRKLGPLPFAGLDGVTNGDDSRTIHQQPYATNLKMLETDYRFEVFQSP